MFKLFLVQIFVRLWQVFQHFLQAVYNVENYFTSKTPNLQHETTQNIQKKTAEKLAKQLNQRIIFYNTNTNPSVNLHVI